jgi:alkylhydroperoxidase family enzyme
MAEAAWISTIDEQDAAGDLARVYAECSGSIIGRPANIMKVHSLNPRSMLAHRVLFRTLMFGPSPLQRYQREMIGVVVSTLAQCSY